MLRNCQDFYRKLLPLFFSKNCRTISDAAALTFTYPLFYNNLTGADDAAVGDLCLSARQGELRFDCKGFSFIYRVLQ